MFTKKIRKNVVYIANGMLEAESIRLLLESFGIIASINQESAGRAYGLTAGPFGEAEVSVEDKDLQDAKKIIEEMENGNLEEK